ncbi:hypothetical protein Q9R08_05545 [Microbacterium sp. QXD-8]|uniref:Uncharacterized protein n=1 Tax=Microbacterium psychrotolerans TaxID=3068321 RepID=A0ABU0YYM7_9MICO|nr:hypothetical protein [Microbacterium sp. QXD-8]MDQ7877437.1 hypothetical protein [Microbacterium sp. QXD-8]
MDPEHLAALLYGLAIVAIGTLLRWRALWVARRVYRTAFWRGQSVDQVALMLRIGSYVVMAMGVIYALLGALGVELTSPR